MKALKTINIGDEITCFYSNTYFGENNKDCLCASCEKFNYIDIEIKKEAMQLK